MVMECMVLDPNISFGHSWISHFRNCVCFMSIVLSANMISEKQKQRDWYTSSTIYIAKPTNK